MGVPIKHQQPVSPTSGRLLAHVVHSSYGDAIQSLQCLYRIFNNHRKFFHVPQEGGRVQGRESVC